MNIKTKQAIIRHGESLIAAFPNCTEKDPVALCKKLRRIETSLTKPLTDACNTGENGNDLDYLIAVKTQKCFDILKPNNEQAKAFFINQDPRGCALKLDDAWTREYNFPEEPKCPTCGHNPTSFHSNLGHSEKVINQNRAAVFAHRTHKRIYTDLGGYGILAPDLTA